MDIRNEIVSRDRHSFIAQMAATIFVGLKVNPGPALLSPLELVRTSVDYAIAIDLEVRRRGPAE